MLAIPTKGIYRSTNSHNVQLDVLCDWIEGSLLFVDDRLSSTDIVDALCEEQIYSRQEMAWQIVENAWTEMRRRQSCIGDGSPFSITSSFIKRGRRWEEAPAYSFCVLLSFAKWYRTWANQFGRDYTEQGALFEDLTKESLERQFADWKIHPTGWTRSRPARLDNIVQQVASLLGESKGTVERWTSPSAKEAGLDLLCYRPFPDRRAGVPVFLMQCASGCDWEGKLHIPRLEIWNRIVEFTAKPKKAFATPFALLDNDFVRNCNLVDGLLIDRYRLLAVGGLDENWLSPQLRNRLITWARQRVLALPRQG